MAKNFSDRLLQSHSRSESLGVRALTSPRDVLQGPKLRDFLAHHRRYIGFGKLVLNDIAHYLSPESAILHLTDPCGRIAMTMASGEVVEDSLFPVGASLSESSVGTTAVALALRHKESVAICGREHYWTPLHGWNCYASPVISYDNRLLGCVSIACPAGPYHGDRLALSSLLARQIENLMSDADTADRSRARKNAATQNHMAQVLTGRQQAVLTLFAGGLSYKEMGRRLGISPKTVEGHLNAICSKFDVRTRRECIAKAIELGLL